MIKTSVSFSVHDLDHVRLISKYWKVFVSNTSKSLYTLVKINKPKSLYTLVKINKPKNL